MPEDGPPHPQKIKNWLKPGPRDAKRYALIAAILIGGWFLFHNSGEGDVKSGHNKNAPVPVGVATVKTGDVHVYLKGLGTVTPRNTITVRTRVDGELVRVLFQEGQLVKEGDLLAEIDPRPFQAQLEQAQGQLARDEALLKDARLNLDRYKKLFAEDSIARQQLDTQAALVKQYEGAVKNDQGLVSNAQVNLDYTKITSPIDGRVGLRQVDPGNIIHAGDQNGIVVVTQLQPITVIFPLPEDNLPAITQRLKNEETLPVEAWDRADKVKIAEGRLLAIDNQVDVATGTIKFKAEFANEDHTLFANQFVNIHMLLDTRQNAVLLPTAAVQRGTLGTFVYVAKEDKTVALQPVTLGPSENEVVASESGVNAGDIVVVDGADSLRDKAKIEIASIDGKPTEAAEKSSDGEHHKHKDDAKGSS